MPGLQSAGASNSVSGLPKRSRRKSPVSLSQTLVGGFVIAGVAAGLAVEKAILAKADVDHGLAETTILVAFALVLRHLALGATEFSGAGSGGHKNNVAPDGGVGNVPLVTSTHPNAVLVITGASLSGQSPFIIKARIAALKCCPPKKESLELHHADQ